MMKTMGFCRVSPGASPLPGTPLATTRPLRHGTRGRAAGCPDQRNICCTPRRRSSLRLSWRGRRWNQEGINWYCSSPKIFWNEGSIRFNWCYTSIATKSVGNTEDLSPIFRWQESFNERHWAKRTAPVLCQAAISADSGKHRRPETQTVLFGNEMDHSFSTCSWSAGQLSQWTVHFLWWFCHLFPPSFFLQPHVPCHSSG